ncbi:hypothetical protein WJX73_004667 [Symbiochloris irregularis]|uniref:Chloride channel protein n=1 Tax=Symbiochloris irregularis TaxID=706552 RepID=A0AAW1NZB9_9CHLO
MFPDQNSTQIRDRQTRICCSHIPFSRVRPWQPAGRASRKGLPADRLSRHRRASFAASASGREEASGQPDEAEPVVLLVACAVGLLTGSSVVVFNAVIHLIRDVAWSTPLAVDDWCSWVRSRPLSSNWSTLIVPPVVGGLIVGALRSLSGGLQEVPAFDPLLERSERPFSQRSPWTDLRLPAPFQKPDQSPTSHAQSATPESNPGAEANAGPEPRMDDSQPDEPAASAPSDLEAMLKQQRQSGAHDAGQPSSRGGAAASASAVSPFAPVLRALAAAVTLGTGNSLGPEGPSVDIGRSIAGALSNVLRSKKRRLSPLLAAGAGAGLAAGFNAPISGVFFAVETVLQRRSNKNTGENSEGVTIAAVLLACLVSSLVGQAGMGATPAFRVPNYRLQSVYEMPLVLLLGALGGVVSSALVYASQVSDRGFQELKQRGAQPALLPAVGGLFTGIIALAYPEVLYQGFGNVDAVLDVGVQGELYTAWLLSQIVVAKVVATALCRGSGLVGGLYAPSIFTGAALGSSFGSVAQRVGAATGYSVVQPQAYALVGVAALLAGTCQVPLTAVLLLFELTHDYSIILPTLGAVGLSYWIASLPTLATALQQLLPTGAGDVLRPPGANATPWQTVADPDTLSGQLGMGIASGNTQEQQRRVQELEQELMEARGQGRRALVMQKFQDLRRSLPFAGAKAEQLTVGSSLSDSASSLDVPISNGTAADRQIQTLTPKQEGDRGLTVQCAIEGSCVLLRRNTLLSEALLLLDETEQSVALVVDDENAVVGLLTRESIAEAMSEAVNA